MGLRLDWIGVGLVTATAWACVLSQRYGGATVAIDSGLVGLLLSYTVVITGQLNWGVRRVSELEQYMTSMERLHALTKVPSERWGDAEGTVAASAMQGPQSASSAVPSEWPQSGTFTVDRLSLRYRPGL